MRSRRWQSHYKAPSPLQMAVIPCETMVQRSLLHPSNMAGSSCCQGCCPRPVTRKHLDKKLPQLPPNATMSTHQPIMSSTHVVSKPEHPKHRKRTFFWDDHTPWFSPFLKSRPTTPRSPTPDNSQHPTIPSTPATNPTQTPPLPPQMSPPFRQPSTAYNQFRPHSPQPIVVPSGHHPSVSVYLSIITHLK